MKLAFALRVYFPYGGLTRDMLAIAQACQRRGHRVRIYTAEYRGTVDGDLDVVSLPLSALTNHGKIRQFSARLRRAVAAFSPDLIVGFNKMPALDVYYTADGCFAHKIRHSSIWYRLTPRCRNYLAFEKAVFSPQSKTEILMLAKNQMRIYRDFYGTPEERMSLLPPGISRTRIAGDEVIVRRQRFRKQWGLNDEDKLLLAVGSGFRTKGLDRTLQAFASLPATWRRQAWLFILGKDRRAPFEKMARALGVADKVRFLGGRDDVPEFLSGADLLVHPAYLENTGTVLLEAIVAGLPVITTEVCGYAHYVSEEDMGVVLPPPFEQSALNEGIQQLLKAPRNQWRERGRHFAQHADIYDLPSHACTRLEELAEQKAHRT